MKTKLIVVLMLLTATAQSQTFGEMKKLFWSQIHGTCSGDLLFEKRVDATGVGNNFEAKHFRVNCSLGSVRVDGVVGNLPWTEFDYLFEDDFENPYLAPLMQITRNAAGLTARVKPEEKGNINLEYANFELDKGVLRLAEAKIRKSNALYEIDIDIKVEFDAAGKYLHHSIKTRSDVLFGSEVSTLIIGEILEAEH
jgi:hypothetical protein